MSDRIRWTCQGCDRPLADGYGWLWADKDRAQEEAQAFWQWEVERRASRTTTTHVATLLETPGLDPVKWERWHWDCHPAPNATLGCSGYGIAVERISTLPHLLIWTAHLLEKEWVPFTDWDSLLRDAAGQHNLVTV